MTLGTSLIDVLSKCFVRIGCDKRHHRAIMVDVLDEVAVELLSFMVESKESGKLRLFYTTTGSLHKSICSCIHMHTLCTDVGWQHLRLIPHSLQYGGAVYDLFVRGLSVSDLQVRGRWHAASSCENYTIKSFSSLSSQQFHTGVAVHQLHACREAHKAHLLR